MLLWSKDRRSVGKLVVQDSMEHKHSHLHAHYADKISRLRDTMFTARLTWPKL